MGKRKGEGRNEARSGRGVGVSTGKRRWYGPLDNSPMLAGLHAMVAACVGSNRQY